MTKIAVVIPSLFELDGKYLKLAVESLRATTDWDIIVVTNGTKNKPYLGDIKGITIHLHTKTQGQCNAVNIGAQAVSPNTDYIMVSNSDMYYGGMAGRRWNKNLRFDYPVFSPNLLEPQNNLGSAPPFIKTKVDGWNLKEFEKNKMDIDFQMTVHTFHHNDGGTWPGGPIEEPGFNLPFFIKRDFWNFLGGYDVAYDPFGSNSDTDLQTRINLAGVTPMRLRDVLVYHFSNKTPTFAPENDAFRMHNFEYFKEKFGFDRDELKSDVWYNKDMLPEDKERIRYDQKEYQA